MNLLASRSLVLLVLVTSILAGCSGPRVPSDETTLKVELLAKRTPSPAVLLKTERRIEGRHETGEPFVLPASISRSTDGTVYVADNNGHAIRRLSPDWHSAYSFGLIDGDGRLRSPVKIEVLGESVFVSDNDGIKVFDRNGVFRELLRIYLGIFDFTVGADDALYVNPVIRYRKEPHPLIIKLDRKGARIRTYGSASGILDLRGVDNQAYVCTTPRYVVAAFKRRPLVSLYDVRDGSLIRDVQLAHPIFADLTALQNDRDFVHPRQGVVALPRFLAGSKIVGGELILLLHLPSPEIVVFTLEGREVRRYRAAGLPVAVDYFGFDVQSTIEGFRFIVGIIDSNGNSTLCELST